MELGKNSITSIIRMCGGLFSLYGDNTHGGSITSKESIEISNYNASRHNSSIIGLKDDHIQMAVYDHDIFQYEAVASLMLLYENSLSKMLFNGVSVIYAGEIRPFAGDSTKVPRGWLLCDGSSFDSGRFPELAYVLGDAWGQHSGNTYYLPDLRGRTLYGCDSSDDFNTVGKKGGSKTAVLVSHNHPLSSSERSFVTTEVGDTIGEGKVKSGNDTDYKYIRTEKGKNWYSAANTGTPSVSSVSTSNNKNLPPYAVVNYIICGGKQISTG